MKTNDTESFYIDINKASTILLVGNGISQAYGACSWSDVLKSLSTNKDVKINSDEIKNIPNPLKAVILSDDHLDKKMKDLSVSFSNYSPSQEEQEQWKMIATLPVLGILTTNYYYEIEKSLNKDFVVSVGRRSSFRKHTTFEGEVKGKRLLATYMQPLSNSLPVWYIHGEAGISDSMTIGHYYYGNLIAKAQRRISQILRKYHDCKKTGKLFEVETWVDLFMLCNVNIVGLGLDFSEFDLWWLLNCKKRHFPETKVDWYDVNIDISKKKLAETYCINFHNTEVLFPIADKDTWFKNYYSSLISQIKVSLINELKENACCDVM